MVQRYNNLDLLVDQMFMKSPRVTGLPSWCADWSKTALPKYLAQEKEEVSTLFDFPVPINRCFPNRRPVYFFAGNDHILVARGVVLDVCESTTPCFDGNCSFLDPAQKGLRENCLRLARSSLGGPYWSYWQRVELTQQPPDHTKHLSTVDIEESKSKTVLQR